MLLIECPWCGARPHTEFRYGGDAVVRRPPDPHAVSLNEWLDYLYLRDNPMGPHLEWWHHVYGCRRWIRMRRDTLTHDVLEVTPADHPSGQGS